MSLSQKIILLVLVVPAVGLLLFGPRPESAKPAPGVVTIEYWEKWTAEEGEQMKSIVHLFNETVGKEKNIRVNYLSMSAVDQKTLVAAAAGVPPDVAGLWDTQIVQFADLDALEPLDDLYRGAGFTPELYKKVFWDCCRYRNRLRAMISTPAAVALHYNARIFAENADALRAAGLDPMRPPQTIAELDRYNAVLTTFVDGKTAKIDRAGFQPSTSWYTANLNLWFGTRFFDPATNSFLFTNDGNRRTWTWFQSYAKKYGPQNVDDFKSGLGNFNSTSNPFCAGKVAMEQQGPWMANYIFNLHPQMSERLLPKTLEGFLPRITRPLNYEWVVAPFPAESKSLGEVSYCPTDVFVIPRGAKHKREAFEFIAFVQRQDVMERLNMLHCKPSPLSAVSEAFLSNHPNPYIDVFERLERSDSAAAVAQIPVYPEIGKRIEDMSQRLSLGRSSPEESLKSTQQIATKTLGDYESRQAARGRR